jgi:tetratricopeptide (TPR) repeat protein
MLHYAKRSLDLTVFSLLVLALCLIAFNRNILWADEFTLWNNVFERSPQKWRPHYRLGIIFFIDKKLPARAVEEFKIALELTPDAYGIRNNIGLVYQSMGLLDEAMKEYTTAIEEEPRESSAYINLGTIYLARGDLETALEWFLRAIDIDPDNVWALANAGFTYGDLEEYIKAIEKHEQALSVNPYHYNAHYGLGLAYEGAGHLDKAIFHWQEYLRMAPETEGWRRNAQRHLERLKSMEGRRR